MLLRLVVDTSIQGAVLGLSDIETKEVLWSKSLEDNRTSSTLLSNCLKEGLDSLSKDVADIREIVVSSGPGSFTGIKVGIAFCYGIKAGGHEEVKLMGLSSLKLVYKNMISEHHGSILLVPSTRNQGFIVKEDQVFNFDISKKENIKELESISKIILIGEWKFLEEILEEKGMNIELVKMDIKKFHDISVKELSFVEIVDKKGQNQYSVVDPLYCREPSVFGK